ERKTIEENQSLDCQPRSFAYDCLEFPEYQRPLQVEARFHSPPFTRVFMKAFPAAAFVSLMFALAVSAQEPQGPPAWMKDVTRLPPGNHADLRPVALEYTLDWNHRINAGRIRLSVMKSHERVGRFVGDAAGRSTGFA